MSDTVGIVLIVVGAILLLLNLKLFSDLKKGREEHNQSITSSVTSAPQKTANQGNYDGIDPATAAAITAAITVLLDDESIRSNVPRAGFLVHKIKRI